MKGSYVLVSHPLLTVPSNREAAAPFVRFLTTALDLPGCEKNTGTGLSNKNFDLLLGEASRVKAEGILRDPTACWSRMDLMGWTAADLLVLC